MTSLLQFEYCVPESQRLADLYGVQLDLEQAIRFCDLHIEIDPTESGILPTEALRREYMRQALCRAAFVTYGRCFGSGPRMSLGSEFIERLPAELQQRHSQVGDLRNKWVAHSVNHFDDVRVRIDARPNAEGDIEICGVSTASQLVGGFTMAWMMAYRALFLAVRELVNADLSTESERLSAKVKTMPLEELTRLKRVDGTPLDRITWDPAKSRGRFRAS